MYSIVLHLTFVSSAASSYEVLFVLADIVNILSHILHYSHTRFIIFLAFARKVYMYELFMEVDEYLFVYLVYTTANY